MKKEVIMIVTDLGMGRRWTPKTQEPSPLDEELLWIGNMTLMATNYSRGTVVILTAEILDGNSDRPAPVERKRRKWTMTVAEWLRRLREKRLVVRAFRWAAGRAYLDHANKRPVDDSNDIIPLYSVNPEDWKV